MSDAESVPAVPSLLSPQAGETAPRRLTAIAVTRRGVKQAQALERHLPQLHVCAPARFARPGDTAFAPGTLGTLMQSLFQLRIGIVLFMATGAAVRLIAPHLRDKRSDPPVVAVDESGRFAISLLSAHLGGANALTAAVARALGAQPVITTASEALGMPSPELIGRAWGWRIDPASDLTAVAAALVNGEQVGVVQECGRPDWLQDPPQTIVHYASVYELHSVRPALSAAIIISDRATALQPSTVPAVCYRPPTIALGCGASRDASAAELRELALTALQQHDLAPESVGLVATIDLKAQEPALLALAAEIGVPLVTYSAAELDRAPGCWQRSDYLRVTVGSGGVCEPAALLAAGVERLAIAKQRSAHTTVAAARQPLGLALSQAQASELAYHTLRRESAL